MTSHDVPEPNTEAEGGAVPASDAGGPAEALAKRMRIRTAIAAGDTNVLLAEVDMLGERLLSRGTAILHSAEAADEALQDTRIIACNRIARYNPTKSLRKWLLVIHTYCCWEVRRRWTCKVLSLDVPPTDDEIGSAQFDPWMALLRRDLWGAIRSRLSAAEQRLLEMRRAGFTAKEIAELHGTPQATARQALHRLLHKLRKQFGQDPP